MRVPARSFTLLLLALLALQALPGCNPLEPKDPLDCSIRLDRYDDPDWSCRKASDYAGSCIPADDFQALRCLELDASATLCADERPFRMHVYLTTSGVSFDGQGQTLELEGASRPGFRTPYSRTLSDITVKNVKVRKPGKYGVDLKRFFRGEELEDGRALEGHSRITLQKVEIEDSGQIGIYVGQNSREIVIEDVTIKRAFMGIYLEAGTSESRITRALIQDSREREGIAVDSSHHNIIEDSLFVGNGHAINVYKNCGEVSGQVCPIRRPDDASHNIIRRNVFLRDDVNVAWRQFKVYAAGHCEGIDVVGFWRDHAAHNLIEENRFEDALLDVRDAPVKVIRNQFQNSFFTLGATPPSGDPAIEFTGIIEGNRFDPGSRFQFNGSGILFDEGLEFRDNVDTQGKCLLYGNNVCSGGAKR
ncbi:MAG: right-handed parallel beta-helix repeat-containing protein [Bdellovibrionales bacterium]|nr:right-handed parallel beta-helix repeat-containing protein [Bdellovibrionales bacterium]